MKQINRYSGQRLSPKLLILASLFAFGAGQFAHGEEITFASGGLTGTITATGACEGNGCASLAVVLDPITGQTNVTGSINGWTIGPKGEDARVNNELENVFNVQCSGTCTGANSLDMRVTDTNFGPITGQFLISFADIQSGIGTSTESAYFDDLDQPFGETTSIDTLGPFSASAEFNSISITKRTDKASPTLVSMTLDQTFSGSNGTSFSGAGDISAIAVPPASVALFLTAMAVAVVPLRRKTKSIC